MAGQDIDRDDVVASRRQLVVRVAVVAGLIVVLLAGLLIFEREQKSVDTANPLPPRGRAVAPIGNAVVSSAPALPEEIAKAVRDAPDVTQAALASMSVPVAVPEETVAPSPPRETEPQSAPAKRFVPEPAASQPIAKSSDRVVVEGGRQNPSVNAPVKPVGGVATPSPQPIVVSPSVTPPVAPAMPSPNGYLIQLGVFNNRGNAEEMRSKLALAGIPSQVEMRVQLGPFKNKEDALKAQQTLRTLGLEQGLLVPPRKP